MFTIFHVFELIGALFGLVGGVALGHRWLGWVGVVLGGVVGFFAGNVLGRVPYVVSFQIVKRDLKRCDVATLKSRLDRDYWIAPLIIAHLVVRGEPIESFRSYVSGLLGSDSPDRRRAGEQILRIWPETAPPSASSAGPAATSRQVCQTTTVGPTKSLEPQVDDVN